jgi:hypothetical protein
MERSTDMPTFTDVHQGGPGVTRHRFDPADPADPASPVTPRDA